MLAHCSVEKDDFDLDTVCVYLWQERYAAKVLFTKLSPSSGPLHSYNIQSVNFDILCVETVETETSLEH